MRLRSPELSLSLLSDTWKAYNQHGELLAAAIAFYAMLSVAPLLVIAVSIAGLVLGEGHARAELLAWFAQRTQQPVSESLVAMLDAVTHTRTHAATFIATLTVLWAASRLFLQMQEALNLIWGVRVKDAPDRPVKQFVWKRVVSIGMVLMCGMLLLATLLVQTALELITRVFDPMTMFPELSPAVLAIQQLVISLALLTCLFAAMYRVLPDASIRFKDVWVGAVLTGILVLLGTWLLSVYLGRLSPTWLQGTVGAFAVFMLWTYYLAHVFLLGAAFTRAWACRTGRPVRAQAHAEKLPA